MARATSRLLARSGCRPGVDVSDHCGKRFVQMMRAKTESWLHQQKENFAFGSDQTRCDLWADLLNGIRGSAQSGG